jgi:hypothetical protein
MELQVKPAVQPTACLSVPSKDVQRIAHQGQETMTTMHLTLVINLQASLWAESLGVGASLTTLAQVVMTHDPTQLGVPVQIGRKVVE